ncbi:P-loop containing nucleoside triphosphate hydrolases superfamily protein [Actinidia rufa]|uniref:P-loop containing nucleoside triphosphate hydrolases superfamily protein n=1 Tax=Actinidia rufa TaxID=165716 RepID=A0A7J0EMC4_9ERIC|nr:P-loop containing nucleoside triphosphate hydrolases superfamily protein [Actinidia rufa]
MSACKLTPARIFFKGQKSGAEQSPTSIHLALFSWEQGITVISITFSSPKPQFLSIQTVSLCRSVFPLQFKPPSLAAAAAAMAALRRFRVATQPELVRRGLGIVARREYAAAQIQYDYDDEEYESESWRNRNRSIEDSEGSVPGRGVQWVIMGDPLVKKRVYAERLAKLLQAPHISMGTLVRQEFHPHSSLYKQV